MKPKYLLVVIGISVGIGTIFLYQQIKLGSSDKSPIASQGLLSHAVSVPMPNCDKELHLEAKANCYVDLAVQSSDPSLCNKVNLASLSSSCSKLFEESIIAIDSPKQDKAYNSDSPINVEFSISPGLLRSLSGDEVIQMYLTNTDGIIGGLITNYLVAEPKSTLHGFYYQLFAPGRNSFIWYPQELIHDAGLETLYIPPKPGQYRILIIVREPISPWETEDNPEVEVRGIGRILFTSQEMTVNNFDLSKLGNAYAYYQFKDGKIFYRSTDKSLSLDESYALIDSGLSEVFTIR